MIVTPIKTAKMLPPQDDLEKLLTDSISKLAENSIVAIASKIVAIGEGNCLAADEVKDKDQLIAQQADLYLSRDMVPEQWMTHTVKENNLVGSAGIDESNGNGYLILWPKNPKHSVKQIWSFLREKYQVKNLGVILTDSHSVPMRRGLVGFALSYYGFQPLRDYRGSDDLFGRELKISQTNIADGLAAAAVMVMGEGNEQTPVILFEDVGEISFDPDAVSDKPWSEFEVKMEEDLYAPFLTAVPWKKGGSGK